ncbi:MAG: hypothetical protein Q8M98_10490 [Candidatus Cloacimonadaceae bacterium]|nr:hypothetical protein [Candidatus Cloacimonadaceae bacterium]
MTQELRERQLRQQIHAIRVKKFHWPLDGFKYVMNGLGFGESLSALPEERLLELKSIMISYRKHGRPYEFTFDKQGKYMFSLMKQAGWTDSDLRAFMLKHYKKSHWNLLNKPERRAVIAMLQNYIKMQAPKQENEQENESKTNRTENQHKENSNGNQEHPQSESDHRTHQD